jgi:hypothetical protein
VVRLSRWLPLILAAAARMTFLADERVIVNPDVTARSRPYDDAVAAAPERTWIQYAGNRAVQPKSGATLCTAPTLEALADR